MKTIILLSLLAITLRQVYGGELKCAVASASCGLRHGIHGETCSEKVPFFKCLHARGCSEDDTVYTTAVSLYKYDKCGASAIIMGWSLPILMFTVANYFSMY